MRNAETDSMKVFRETEGAPSPEEYEKFQNRITTIDNMEEIMKLSADRDALGTQRYKRIADNKEQRVILSNKLFDLENVGR